MLSYIRTQELLQLVFIPYWHHNVVILPQPWVESKFKNPDGTVKRAERYPTFRQATVGLV